MANSVHLVTKISVRNDVTRYQYIIVPPSHAAEGRHVGTFPDIASAYHAALKRGADAVYLFSPDGFPFVMRDASDTRGIAW